MSDEGVHFSGQHFYFNESSEAAASQVCLLDLVCQKCDPLLSELHLRGRSYLQPALQRMRLSLPEMTACRRTSYNPPTLKRQAKGSASS